MRVCACVCGRACVSVIGKEWKLGTIWDFFLILQIFCFRCCDCQQWLDAINDHSSTFGWVVLIYSFRCHSDWCVDRLAIPFDSLGSQRTHHSVVDRLRCHRNLPDHVCLDRTRCPFRNCIHVSHHLDRCNHNVPCRREQNQFTPYIEMNVKVIEVNKPCDTIDADDFFLVRAIVVLETPCDCAVFIFFAIFTKDLCDGFLLTRLNHANEKGYI